jgi:hypothetical protein
MTSRGLTEGDFAEVAGFLHEVLEVCKEVQVRAGAGGGPMGVWLGERSSRFGEETRRSEMCGCLSSATHGRPGPGRDHHGRCKHAGPHNVTNG